MHTTGIHVNVIYTNWHGRSTDFTLRMICKIGNTEGFAELQKILLVRKFTCTNKNGNYVKEISPFWSLAGLIPFASDTVTR